MEAFGQLVFGATFEAARGEPEISEEARTHNLGVLARLRPDVVAGDISSRAAIRATTQDRLPFAGASPQNEKAPDGTPAPSGRYRLIGGLGIGLAGHAAAVVQHHVPTVARQVQATQLLGLAQALLDGGLNTLTAANGCDSIVTLNLTIKPDYPNESN